MPPPRQNVGRQQCQTLFSPFGLLLGTMSILVAASGLLGRYQLDETISRSVSLWVF